MTLSILGWGFLAGYFCLHPSFSIAGVLFLASSALIDRPVKSFLTLLIMGFLWGIIFYWRYASVVPFWIIAYFQCFCFGLIGANIFQMYRQINIGCHYLLKFFLFLFFFLISFWSSINFPMRNVFDYLGQWQSLFLSSVLFVFPVLNPQPLLLLLIESNFFTVEIIFFWFVLILMNIFIFYSLFKIIIHQKIKRILMVIVFGWILGSIWQLLPWKTITDLVFVHHRFESIKTSINWFIPFELFDLSLIFTIFLSYLFFRGLLWKNSLSKD